MCDIADTDVAEIAVSHGDNSYTVVKSGSDWKATKPAKLDVDTAKVTPIAAAFKEWKANELRRGQSREGERPGQAQGDITAKGKAKGATCTVKVGDETKDKLNYYVLRGEEHRRLPGAEVERRPRAGQGRRPQEGRHPRPPPVAGPGGMPVAAQNPHGRAALIRAPLLPLPPARGERVIDAGRLPLRGAVLHVDDDDAAVPLFAVVLLFVFLILGTVPLPPLVPRRVSPGAAVPDGGAPPPRGVESVR